MRSEFVTKYVKIWYEFECEVDIICEFDTICEFDRLKQV